MNIHKILCFSIVVFQFSIASAYEEDLLLRNVPVGSEIEFTEEIVIPAGEREYLLGEILFGKNSDKFKDRTTCHFVVEKHDKARKLIAGQKFHVVGVVANGEDYFNYDAELMLSTNEGEHWLLALFSIRCRRLHETWRHDLLLRDVIKIFDARGVKLTLAPPVPFD